jgi:hypothetical protein
VSDPWVDMARVAVAPTREFQARVHEKIDDDLDEVPTPVRRRANPKLGEGVAPATIYGRARRARLKAMAASVV